MLLPLGTYWPQNAAGQLLNPCAREFLTPEGLELAEATAQVYRDVLGSALRAVYLRGSAVRGTSVAGLSDWDSFAVVEWDSNQAFRKWAVPSWAAEAAAQLEVNFPSVSKVELVVCDWAEARPGLNPRVRAMVKIESLLWEGEDLARQVPPFKPDHLHLKRNLRWLNEDWQNLKQLPPSSPSPETIRAFVKTLIRSAFESVMDLENRYAVDFFPCIQSFLVHHPQFESTLHKLVAHFAAPPSQTAPLIEHAAPLVRFLSSKAGSQS